MASRTVETEAVVLRSLRFGEADSILHLYSLERGRVGAIAKGLRKTRSRFGGRLEPFSHVETVLYEGRGDLFAVTDAELVRSHDASRRDPYRMAVGHMGLEAVLRLFVEQEQNSQVFHALIRFLNILDGIEERLPSQPAIDPLVLSFQLKLLWLSGYFPHLSSCASCGSSGPLVAFHAEAGGGVCERCRTNAVPLSSEGFTAIRTLLERPLSGSREVEDSGAGLRGCLRAIEALYEFHGGFRLRTASQRA